MLDQSTIKWRVCLRVSALVRAKKIPISPHDAYEIFKPNYFNKKSKQQSSFCKSSSRFSNVRCIFNLSLEVKTLLIRTSFIVSSHKWRISNDENIQCTHLLNWNINKHLLCNVNCPRSIGLDASQGNWSYRSSTRTRSLLVNFRGKIMWNFKKKIMWNYKTAVSTKCHCTT